MSGKDEIYDFVYIIIDNVIICYDCITKELSTESVERCVSEDLKKISRLLTEGKMDLSQVDI